MRTFPWATPWVLQRRDGLGFRLETTNERTVAREPVMQDLHGHVALHPRLEPTEDDARGPLADLLHQSIPAEGFASEVERSILAEDPFVQSRELG